MEKRDILNSLGEKIGELEMPDNTSEAMWAEKLAKYSAAVPVQLPDVTPRQIRQAMVLKGVSIAQIDAAIDSMPEPLKSLARIEWEYSTMFIRANPLVSQVGAALGWSSQQLDELWKFAKGL